MTARRSRRRKSVAVFAASATLVFAPPAVAWGDAGHVIIATIAYARLTPAARRGVDALLARDADTLTPPDFASRATWADRYRDADRNGSRVQYLGTRFWHFVDIDVDRPDLDAACHGDPPLTPGTPASAGPAEACVIDKVEQFDAELRDRTLPRGERLLALKFMIHLVGDLHQPLHAATRRDHGGNDLAVRGPGGAHVIDNLHAYWDVHLVDALGGPPRTIAARMNRRIAPREAGAWAAGRPADWARESNAAARAVAYRFDAGALQRDAQGRSVVTLDAHYDARALPLVRSRLSKAGVRLAALLNAAFD
ncbi:MAG: S1/P1 Nuclease [Proteobacteria bacterium]|nr:S1/P1 Nuclease [Pseudomonadota bacterium]